MNSKIWKGREIIRDAANAERGALTLCWVVKAKPWAAQGKFPTTYIVSDTASAKSIAPHQRHAVKWRDKVD
jgi:hypothetical protein